MGLQLSALGLDRFVKLLSLLAVRVFASVEGSKAVSRPAHCPGELLERSSKVRAWLGMSGV
jgi:hypothetical protein